MHTLRILPAALLAFLSLLAVASSAWAQSITNGTFETPSVSTYQSNPSGTGWTFSGGTLSGISSGTWGGSGFGVTGTRTGQFAYLQWNAGVGGSVSQSVTFPTPGRYRLEESIGGRDLASGGHGNAAYAITVSGGIFSGGGNTFTGMPFQNYLDEITVTTAGTYTLTYSNVTGSGDDTFFVDNVSITYLGPLILVPTVAQNTAGLGNNATTLIINGTNFSTTGDNTVAFNNGAAGTVTAATATQLTVTFTTKPASTGSLTAVVTSNGQSSGAAVQVATVVPSNPAGTNKSISIAAGGTHTFASSDWGFTDPNSSPADNFAAVTLTTLPGSGTLAVDSSPVTTAPRSVSMLAGPAGVTWTARENNRNWNSITSSADGSKLAAVATGGQIYTSTDGGVSWTARESNRNWYSITSSADGSKLAAVVYGEQIYTSTDGGASWTARESYRQWQSITSSADGSKLAAVAYNGQIYTSTDGGASWFGRESNRSWYSITSSADGSKLAAVAYNGQIYTSTDWGSSWTARESNRRWYSITSSADGSRLAAVEYNGQIHTSTDGGVSWNARESSRGWISITSSADGSKLAAVTYGGQIYTCTDGGVNWTARESNRNWWCISSSADGGKLAAVATGGQIHTSVGSSAPVISYSAPATSGSSSFTFQVQDDAASNNLDLSPNTITFNIVPTVTLSTTNLGRSPSTLVINGTGFSTTPGNNTVSFSNGAGTVTAATATQLTVTFTTKPTSYGSLTAVVTSNGQSSGAAVQVATIIPSPPAGTDKTLTLAAGSTHTFASSDWGFTDPGSSPADNFASVTLTTLPASGTLRVDSSPVTTTPRSVSMLPGPAGVTWTARESKRYWSAITSSADGSKLAAVVSGVMDGGQICTSTDGGVTWTAWEGYREWRSITSSADGSKLAAVVGGGQIFISTDGGVSWTARASNRNWYSITSSADGSKLAAVVLFGQIHTSTDGGVSWTARESDRNWLSITSSADGSKLAAVTYGGQIYTSTDGGVSWTARESNRPWSSITSSADGSKLAAVTYGSQIYTSTDGGVSWTARESNRSWRSITSSADGSKLAAVVENGQIYTSVGSAPVISYSAPATAGSTSFTFQVQDDAAGNNLDPSPNTMTFNIVPTVVSSTAGLAPDATTLTITGTGFSTTPGNNTVVFTPAGSGTVTATTPTSLTVSGLSGLSPGTLSAVVTTNGQSSGAAVPVATVLTALQSWRQTHFGTTTNTGTAADTYDADNDGLANLLEYAFALDPTAGGGTAQLPQAVHDAEANTFTVQFTQPAGVTGVTYGAQSSPSLEAGSWQPVPDAGTGGNHVFRVVLSEETRLFIRLEVTAAP